MKGLWGIVLSIALTLPLAACMVREEEPAPKVAAAPIAINPFPEATEVRMFIHKDYIDVDDHGKVTEGSLPASGVVLTPAEILDLRGAVSYTTPPEWGTACCIPRHAFLFYDKDHHFLGSLTVCFECGCAYLKGMPPPPKDQDDLTWDQAVLERIVKAHGQPLRFDAEPPQGATSLTPTRDLGQPAVGFTGN